MKALLTSLKSLDSFLRSFRVLIGIVQGSNSPGRKADIALGDLHIEAEVTSVQLQVPEKRAWHRPPHGDTMVT